MKHAYRILNPATGLPTETPSYSGAPSAEAISEIAGPVGVVAAVATGSAIRPHPKQIARAAEDNGHVPTFLAALCELLMCSDPWPASAESERELKTKADVMARKLGFTDWVEAYHGLCWPNVRDEPRRL